MAVDPNHNEFTLIRNAAIGLIILNLTIIMFAYATGGGSSPISGCQLQSNYSYSSASCQMNNITKSVNSTSVALTTSFQNSTTSPLKPDTNSLDFWAGFTNDVIIIPNFLWHAGSFILNLLLLFFYSIYIVLFVVFGMIPALFSSASFGIFTVIFDIIYSSMFLVLIGLGVYIILNRTGEIHIGF